MEQEENKQSNNELVIDDVKVVSNIVHIMCERYMKIRNYLDKRQNELMDRNNKLKIDTKMEKLLLDIYSTALDGLNVLKNMTGGIDLYDFSEKVFKEFVNVIITVFPPKLYEREYTVLISEFKRLDEEFRGKYSFKLNPDFPL